jgi:hypothetical protein
VLVDRFVELSQALWLLAFAFYTLDVARLVPPGRLLLRESSKRRFAPVLASFPFEIAKKELYVAGLLVPWRGVLMARWSGAADTRTQTLQRTDEILDALLLFRIVGCVNFVLLFIAAPTLTMLVGLGGALLLVAPVVYPLNLFTGMYAFRARERFGLTRTAAGWLLADTLLCPPYGANWAKRIARLQPELAPDLARMQDRLVPADRERVSSVIAMRQAQANTTEGRE